MEADTAKIGKRGTVVIPVGLRRKYGFEEGSVVILQKREQKGSFYALWWLSQWKSIRLSARRSLS